MKKIINLFLGLLISILLLILSVQYFTFNSNYLYNNMDKNEKISVSDYEKISNEITSYLKNENDSLLFKVTLNNNEIDAFNKKEIKHMIDVKNIYLLLNKLKYLSIIFILLIVILIRKKFLFNSIYYSNFISLLFLIIIGFFINIDFSKYFTYFHELAFSNDLWLLNPRTDLLINLLPLSFFIKISINIIKLFFISEIILSLTIYFIKKKVLIRY